MKKILIIIKRIADSIVLFFIMIGTKVFAMTEMYERAQPEYGVQLGTPGWAKALFALFRIVITLLIPIIAIIGLVKYFKKSKSKIIIKILVTIGTIIVVYLILFGIVYIFNLLQNIFLAK